MKFFIVFITLIFGLLATSSAVDYKTSEKHSHGHNYNFLDDLDIDLDDDGTLVIQPDDHHGFYIEITDTYELFVNGDPVKLNNNQQELVREYYEQFNLIIESAKAIGFHGAKIGVEGAAVGVAALAGVFKLLDPDYDSDDLEREIEEKADKLERKAERLEIKAEQLEDTVDQFEMVHERFCEEIPEIEELNIR